MSEAGKPLQEKGGLDEELRTNKERIDELAEQNRTYVWEIDREGRYTYVSDTVEGVLGYAPEELLGKPYYNLHPSEQREVFIEKTLDMMERAEKFTEFENPVVAKNGAELLVASTGLPMVNQSGEVKGYRGMDTDITVRKRVERELREAKEKAEAANIAKSSFLANMSDELLTPMTTLVGFAGLLRDTELTEEQSRYVETIYESAESLSRLLEDILDYAKIEAHKLELKELDFHPEELIESCMTPLAWLGWKKGVEVIYEVDPGLPVWLHGDPIRLRQILTNLISNAIKFTEQGEVMVDCRVEEEGETEVTLAFQVKDTGVGIPQHQQSKLFEKFSQLEQQSTRRQGGAGLGLAICKYLTTQMRGEIGVESEPGVGSLFWFTVRLAKPALPPPPKCELPENLRGARVLVVDDNHTVRELLVRRLGSWGMRPVSVDGAASALREIERGLEEQDPFVLGLIDLEMPGMDGQALGRSIRADKRFAAMGLLLLVPAGMSHSFFPQHQNNFMDWVVKPIRSTKLPRLLSKALQPA